MWRGERLVPLAGFDHAHQLADVTANGDATYVDLQEGRSRAVETKTAGNRRGGKEQIDGKEGRSRLMERNGGTERWKGKGGADWWKGTEEQIDGKEGRSSIAL
jgi:hypothetical protein